MPELTNSHALIIAIANYQKVRALSGTVLKDARDIYELLIDPDRCAYPEKNVALLLDREATGARMRSELKLLAARSNKDSTIFIYVSSHGGRIESGSQAGQYILPVDVDCSSKQALSNTAIGGDEFSAALRTIPAQKVVVVFDCCHSGGIGEVKDIEKPFLKEGLLEEYYDVLKTGRGRVIMASSRSTESSVILPGATNSLFTEHFLAALKGGAPAPDGFIRVFDVFDYTQKQVASAGINQHPIFKAELEENFPLALYRGGIAPLPPAPARPDDGFSYDLFISYRQQEPDKSWVRRILLPRLKAAGLRVFIDFECFRPGRMIVDEMERAVVKSRYTVCVLTPAYLQSTFTDFEGVISQHLGMEKRQARYLGVLREPCSPRLRIRARYWLDMTNDDEFEENVTRLIYQATQDPAT